VRDGFRVRAWIRPQRRSYRDVADDGLEALAFITIVVTVDHRHKRPNEHQYAVAPTCLCLGHGFT
jgi:hypothetical protein